MSIVKINLSLKRITRRYLLDLKKKERYFVTLIKVDERKILLVTK